MLVDCTLQTLDLDSVELPRSRCACVLRVPSSEFAWACWGASSEWDMLRRVYQLRTSVAWAHSVARASGNTLSVETRCVGSSVAEWQDTYAHTLDLDTK